MMHHIWYCIGVAWLAIVCGAGCANRSHDSFTSPDGKAFFPRSREGYRNCARFIEFRLRGALSERDWDSAYANGMLQWTRAITTDDTSGQSRVAAVTAWSPHARIPEPGAPFAAFILALSNNGFFIGGARALPFTALRHYVRPETVVLAETAKGYRFIKRIGQRGQQAFVQFSDDSKITCSAPSLLNDCQGAGVRQWLIVSADRKLGCALLAVHSGEHAGAGYMFSYPRALEEHVRNAREAAQADPFPGIPDSARCE